MRVREWLRDAVLVAAAVGVGWWMHGVGAVHAAGGDGGMAFQFTPGGDQSSLAVYDPEERTLYVYPRVGVGNSHIGCQYMFHLRRMGDSIDREICKPGSVLP